jgi:predicted transcriptional regulator
MTYSPDETGFNPGTGRKYKITSFTKEYAASRKHSQHYIALFEKGEVLSKMAGMKRIWRVREKTGKTLLPKRSQHYDIFYE